MFPGRTNFPLSLFCSPLPRPAFRAFFPLTFPLSVSRALAQARGPPIIANVMVSLPQTLAFFSLLSPSPPRLFRLFRSDLLVTGSAPCLIFPDSGASRSFFPMKEGGMRNFTFSLISPFCPLILQRRFHTRSHLIFGHCGCVF